MNSLQFRAMKAAGWTAAWLLLACFLPDDSLPAQSLTLQSAALTESSGVAQVGEDIWSHNDSGDGPRLFVFRSNGQLRHEINILGAESIDWEDMCAFQRMGRQYVAVGDVGDNSFNRPDVRIYVIEVPDDYASCLPTAEKHLRLPVRAEYRVAYPDGAVNCEALAYDPRTDSFLLATKETLRCRLYRVACESLVGAHSARAQLLGTLALPLVTAADISPDGSRLVLMTYGPGCLIGRRQERAREHEWSVAGENAVSLLPLPARKQGESVCFSGDGQSLFLTSEFVPTPLIQVPLPIAADGSLGR